MRSLFVSLVKIPMCFRFHREEPIVDFKESVRNFVSMG